MNAGLLYFVAVVYFAVAIEYASHDRWGMALAFVAYALANVGFALEGKPL